MVSVDHLRAKQIREHARRAVKNARRKWPLVTDQDAEDVESGIVERMWQKSPDDPIAWATRCADRDFGMLHRRKATAAKHSARAKAALARKGSNEPVSRGRPKNRRYESLSELKAAVVRECQIEFRNFAKRDWESTFSHWVKPVREPYRAEQEARSLFESLRTAMFACSTFVARGDRGRLIGRGTWESFLEWWVPQFIAPLLKQPPFEANLSQDKMLDPFGWFVCNWDRKDFLQMGRRGKYGSGFLADRELAVISLLGGFFPASIESSATRAGKLPRALTVGDVVETQKSAVRTARRRHGTLKDAISKALAGVAPMPKNARYVVQACADKDGKLVPQGDQFPFRTLDEAVAHVETQLGAESVAEMELGRLWFVWAAGYETLLGRIELMNFDRDSARLSAVPDKRDRTKQP